MENPEISAADLLGLLDEIGFVEKVFWQLPPGVLLTNGSTIRALAARFGYPGLHRPIDADSFFELDWSNENLAGEVVYYFDDLENPGEIQQARQFCASQGARVVDVLSDLYPVWCGGAGAISDISERNEPVPVATIVCPARSGSTHLSRLLTNSGQLGTVNEHMRHHVAALVRTGNIDLPQWLSRVSKNGQKNGVFVTKIINAFLASATTSYSKQAWRDLLCAAKGWTLITISREDSVARAVSTYIAESVGSWQVHNPSEFASLEAKAEAVVYNYHRLKEIYEKQQRYDDVVARFVADRGGADLALDFRDIISDGVDCAWRVLQCLGKDTAVAKSKMLVGQRLPVSSSTRKNEEFKLRFQLDFRADRDRTSKSRGD